MEKTKYILWIATTTTGLLIGGTWGITIITIPTTYLLAKEITQRIYHTEPHKI